MDEPIFLEMPVLWSRVNDAVRFWGSNGPKEWQVKGDETSCVIPIVADMQVRKMRDWLHKEFGDGYEMTGICEDIFPISREKAPPFALRFRFPKFDDKLLFALRWL